MKRILFFVSLGLLLISSSSFATKTTPTAIKNPTFNPVPWYATLSTAGFSLENQTNKMEYVQVAIERGSIQVFTVLNGKLGPCKKNLNAISGPFSVICELAPTEVLYADLDFAKMEDASGTYQVEM